LPNGNVASRVLPVRIHDLDIADIKLCESILDTVLRGIEFIYKEPGVNRPLKSDDDEKINLNKTKYRNQINKVSNAIKEIISGIKDPVVNSQIERVRVTLPETDRREIPWKKYAVPALIATIIFIVALIILLPGIKKPSHLSSTPGKSIAVLPFKNLSSDSEQEYFSEGLVEEILDRLCRIGGLKVISRTSSGRFKDTNLSLKEIASQLGASAIMEGSVQKSGNNIRITIQLIDAKTDTHLWSRIYDKSFSDIFSIYSDVSQAVAKELHATITPQEKKLIEKVLTTDMTAYDAYFMGKFHVRQLNQKDYEMAMQFFELAIEKDPKFALAYAGISRVWASRQQMGLIKPEDAAPKAEAAIMKALELDSTQSEVHNTLAAIKVWTRWDWEGGEASFRKAIELNPNNADAHSVYSHLLLILGRHDEAMNHIEIALELDPLNPKIKSFYGIDLMFLHRYDDAVTAFQKALELNPLQGVAENITPALFLAGREEEAFKMTKNRWKNNKEYLRALDEGYAEAGFQGGCKRLADFRADNLKTTYSNPIALTTIYSMAGDTTNALFWLEKAYEEHNPNVPYLLNPLYDKLRENPRFQAIARKMNLQYR
jgi:TolB-like protein/Tfp pilus assembly protein PilF